jgi:hypothetical protein
MGGGGTAARATAPLSRGGPPGACGGIAAAGIGAPAPYGIADG